MDTLHTILLGVVQGLGEFLPISSSAHLVLLPWFLGWEPHSLTLDVALHIGTLFSVLVFYRETWLRLFKAPFLYKDTQYAGDRKLLGQLLVATLPGVAMGLFAKDYAETIFREPQLIGASLAFMGVVLWLCDRNGKNKTRTVANLGWRDCILIGIAQGFAIIPGFSRSGSTISAALVLGFRREEAARFSFLMSAPIIAGAAVLQGPEIIKHKLYSIPAFGWALAQLPWWAGLPFTSF